MVAIGGMWSFSGCVGGTEEEEEEDEEEEAAAAAAIVATVGVAPRWIEGAAFGRDSPMVKAAPRGFFGTTPPPLFSAEAGIRKWTFPELPRFKIGEAFVVRVVLALLPTGMAYLKLDATPPFNCETPPFNCDTPPFNCDTPPFDCATPPFNCATPPFI